MSNCIFCKIINKEIPGKIIYEDDVCIAFLDLSQATYGHTLVIPKKHFENILEVDAQTLAHVMQVTQKLAKQIVEKLNAKGLNILTNTNEVAGQTVHHFHVHILPRYDEKELVIEFNDHSQDVDLDEVYLWSLWGISRVIYEGEVMKKYADNRWQRMKKNMKKVQ